MELERRPDDADPKGRPYLNRFDETVQRYHSAAIAEEFPTLDIEGFEEPGTIWVTYFFLGDELGAFDIELYHDEP